MWATRPWRHQVVRRKWRTRAARWRRESSGAIGVEPPWVGLVPLLVPCRKLLLVVPRGLIRRIQQDQRWMIPIRVDQPRSLVVQHSEHLSVGIERGPPSAVSLALNAS